jgi:hypothetical protein
VIVIRPRAERAPASSDAAWTGAGGEPRWRTTLARAYRIMTTHSVYEDLRRIEKTNNRVVWANDLVSKLTDLLETHPDARSTLGEFADQISAQRETWNDPNRAPTDRATSELLKYVVRAATGVEQKRTIDVELVAAPDSPRLAGGARGFLAERLRASDFLVGYQQTVEWMETGLTEYPLPRNLRELGVNEARDRATSIPGWTGGVSVSRRTAVKGSAKLVRAGLRAGRVGLRELRVPRQPSR